MEANIRRVKELTNQTRFVEVLKKKVEIYDEKLKASERLAAIGATAGMVGHDIRNPLQAMTSDLYLLNEEVKDMHDSEKKTAMQESINSMQENISYIDKIVQDLQDYAKILTPERKLFDLSVIVASIFQTIAIPNDIKLVVNIQKDLIVNSDSVYIRRALTNLITNAVQAMPKG
jgi:signal transduction histidine kinase